MFACVYGIDVRGTSLDSEATSNRSDNFKRGAFIQKQIDSMPMNKHNTREQSSQGKPQDHAENGMSEGTQSSWESQKYDVKDAPHGVEAPRSSDSTDAQPPARLTGLKLKEPESYAAGIPGVLRAMKHLEMDEAFARGT